MWKRGPPGGPVVGGHWSLVTEPVSITHIQPTQPLSQVTESPTNLSITTRGGQAKPEVEMLVEMLSAGAYGSRRTRTHTSR